MSQPERTITIDVEVRYAETDQMGVVHHSNYLVWFELARTRLCSETGFHYSQIEEMGYQLLVTGAWLGYRDGARYGNVVQVACALEKMTSRSLTFGYRVTREEKLLVEGATEHVWVNVSRGRACRVPKELRGPFAELLAASA